MKDIRPIRTESDYDWALAEIERYFVSPPPMGSAEGDRFDVLAALIEAYEEEHYPVPDLDPIAAIEAYMEMAARTQADLAELLGSRSRASEILRRRRPLTLEMIHRLNTTWGIPADILVKPYSLSATANRVAGRRSAA